MGYDFSVMIWAAFWDYKISDLYLLKRDFESKKHKYSANFYIQVLDDNLPDIYEPGFIFMQNNVFIYTTKKVREWFKENGVKIIEWSFYNFDLNLIEYLWYHLKKFVYKMNPDIEKLADGKNTIRETLFRALFKAWQLLNKDILYNIIDNIIIRINVIIAAED